MEYLYLISVLLFITFLLSLSFGIDCYLIKKMDKENNSDPVYLKIKSLIKSNNKVLKIDNSFTIKEYTIQRNPKKQCYDYTEYEYLHFWNNKQFQLKNLKADMFFYSLMKDKWEKYHKDELITNREDVLQ